MSQVVATSVPALRERPGPQARRLGGTRGGARPPGGLRSSTSKIMKCAEGPRASRIAGSWARRGHGRLPRTELLHCSFRDVVTHTLWESRDPRGRAVGAVNPSAAGHLISPGLSHPICITRSPFQDGGSLALGLPLRAPTLAHITAPPRHNSFSKRCPPKMAFGLVTWSRHLRGSMSEIRVVSIKTRGGRWRRVPGRVSQPTLQGKKKWRGADWQHRPLSAV